MMMSGRSGYEYSHQFRVEDEIILRYMLPILGMIFSSGRGFLFEIRTNLKLKRVKFDDDDESDEIKMLGSDRFGVAVNEDGDFLDLAWKTDFRLEDYWMNENVIEKLVREVVYFTVAVMQRKANPPPNPSRWMILIAVGLDVTTVQRGDEPIDVAIVRAIKPESLMPMYLWDTEIPATMSSDEKPYSRYKGFFMELPMSRVEEEICRLCVGFMQVICQLGLRCHLSIGAQISFFPCMHACHSRCIFNWLQEGNSSCPLCGAHIPTDTELSGMVDSESESESDSD